MPMFRVKTDPLRDEAVYCRRMPAKRKSAGCRCFA